MAKITAVLTSFRFSKNEKGSFIIGSFKGEADASYSAILGEGIPFEYMLKSKSMGIPFMLEEKGTWSDKSGSSHVRYSAEMGTI